MQSIPLKLKKTPISTAFDLVSRPPKDVTASLLPSRFDKNEMRRKEFPAPETLTVKAKSMLRRPQDDLLIRLN